MKTTQWAIALTLLVVMVFGITFFMNYVGDTGGQGSGSGVQTPTDFPQLSFAVKSLPSDTGRYALEMERGADGHADFWFYNPNEKVVKVGLNRVGCKCSSVELWTAPAEALALRAADAAGIFGVTVAPDLAGTGWLGDCLRAVIVEDPTRYADFEERIKPRQLREEPVEVSPGGIGWVRLKWKGNQSGPQNLNADLWYQHAALGPTQKLQVWAHFHDSLPAVGLTGTRDKELGTLTPDRLPFTGYLFTGSHTRRTLNLKVSHVPLRGRMEEDPFVVGTPELTTLEEWRSHEPLPPDAHETSPYKCVYRIPYTLNAGTADGKTLLEQGSFVRRVEITLADEDVDRQVYLISGTLTGDIRIEGAKRIDLRTFQRTSGSLTETRQVTTGLANPDIEIDRGRTASYLHAELEAVPKSDAEGKSWFLKVKVEPNAANGPFPRQDPVYRDSAVYLRFVGGAGRALRIPVYGLASQ